MKRKELIITSLSFGALLFVLNEVALYLELYWTLWWLDLAFHFVGGFAVGGLAIGLFVVRGMSFWRSASTVLLTTFIIALVWESYEFLFRDSYMVDYLIDTLTDVILGVAGGLSSLYYAPRSLWKYK
ncbi:MAG: hypothetical protein WDZ74_02240 [Candidatus Paceibacterota bacterium]